MKVFNVFIGCCALLSSSICLAVNIDGTTNMVTNPTSYSFTDTSNSATGLVWFVQGFSIANGCSATLNIVTPVNGDINLNDTGKIILAGDLLFASKAGLSHGGNIEGNDNVIFLGGDLTIPAGKTLKISGNTIIDGQGHDLIFQTGGILSIDGSAGTQLTLKNIIVKGISNSIVFGSQLNQKLILDNVQLFLDGDFTFDGGGLEVHNKVAIDGAHILNYVAPYDCVIARQAELKLGIDVVFNYAPSDMSTSHLVTTDKTSVLFFNGCTLQTPSGYGVILKDGHVISDHKSYLKSLGDPGDNLGVIFGNGDAAHDVLIDLMPGCSLTVGSGTVTYNNGGDEV